MSRATVTESAVQFMIGLLKRHPNATNAEIEAMTKMGPSWVSRTAAIARARMKPESRSTRLAIIPSRRGGFCTCSENPLKECPLACQLAIKAGFACPNGAFPGIWEGKSTKIERGKK